MKRKTKPVDLFQEAVADPPGYLKVSLLERLQAMSYPRVVPSDLTVADVVNAYAEKGRKVHVAYARDLLNRLVENGELESLKAVRPDGHVIRVWRPKAGSPGAGGE